MSRRQKPVILYMDDEIDQCHLVGNFFCVRGWDIVFACSGKMAKEVLEKITPSIIFLDLLMPEMNGKEFLRYLRSCNSKIPVFVISGYPQEISDLEDEAFEIQGIFSKPVNLSDLIKETRRIIDSQDPPR